MAILAVVSVGLSATGTASAAGWKSKLKPAGLLKTNASSKVIHAASTIKAEAKAKVDPAQAAVQRLKIKVPANIAPGPMNTVEPAKTAAYLDKLAAQRALNPTRFDKNHPVLGALIGAQEALAGPNGTSPATIALAQKALLPDTIYYRYFEARRALDPARFDYYHPYFGPLLAENQNVNNQLVAAQTLIPPVGQAVPEPGVLALTFVGVATVAVGSWRRRSSSTRPA